MIKSARNIAILLACLGVLAGFADAASAWDGEERFKMIVTSLPAGKKVEIEYNHPSLGWVYAGFVDIMSDGRMIFKLRGRDPEEIQDLSERLSQVSRQFLGDAQIGQRLALNIRTTLQ